MLRGAQAHNALFEPFVSEASWFGYYPDALVLAHQCASTKAIWSRSLALRTSPLDPSATSWAIVFLLTNQQDDLRRRSALVRVCQYTTVPEHCSAAPTFPPGAHHLCASRL